MLERDSMPRCRSSRLANRRDFAFPTRLNEKTLTHESCACMLQREKSTSLARVRVGQKIGRSVAIKITKRSRTFVARALLLRTVIYATNVNDARHCATGRGVVKINWARLDVTRSYVKCNAR